MSYDIESKYIHADTDRLMKYNETIERFQHGAKYGLRRLYYFCEECQLGFGSDSPYKILHFKHQGLNYGIPRPINGLMPACPGCRNRDNVHRLNRYKKR